MSWVLSGILGLALQAPVSGSLGIHVGGSVKANGALLWGGGVGAVVWGSDEAGRWGVCLVPLCRSSLCEGPGVTDGRAAGGRCAHRKPRGPGVRAGSLGGLVGCPCHGSCRGGLGPTFPRKQGWGMS